MYQLTNRISKGAPAKFAHHGLIEKAPVQSNRISCSKCNYYDDSNKFCNVQKAFVPSLGYDRWKYCSRFKLIASMQTAQNLHYVEKVKKAVEKKAQSIHTKKNTAGGVLKLKNLVSGKTVVYEIHPNKKGPNILHPSDALVLKAKQSTSKKSFHWEGKTYRVVE